MDMQERRPQASTVSNSIEENAGAPNHHPSPKVFTSLRMDRDSRLVLERVRLVGNRSRFRCRAGLCFCGRGRSRTCDLIRYARPTVRQLHVAGVQEAMVALIIGHKHRNPYLRRIGEQARCRDFARTR